MNESETVPGALAKTSSSQAKDRTNFAFVNYHLSNLDLDTYHLHDYSHFTHPGSLKLFKHSSIVLPEYHMSSEESASNQEPTEDEVPINLTGLLTSIGELILHMHQIDTNVNSKSQDTICYRLNGQQQQQQGACQCLAKALPVHVSNSNISGFFLKTLNANFFKLKHLTEYLDGQIARLASVLSADVNVNPLHFTQADLTRPMDDSLNTLAILSEVRALLVSTCMQHVYKALVKKTNESKKLSVYYNFYAKEEIKSKRLFKVMSSIS